MVHETSHGLIEPALIVTYTGVQENQTIKVVKVASLCINTMVCGTTGHAGATIKALFAEMTLED
jgi:hypothetical protein